MSIQLNKKNRIYWPNIRNFVESLNKYFEYRIHLLKQRCSIYIEQLFIKPNIDNAILMNRRYTG